MKPIENHLNAEVKPKMKRPWKLQLLVIRTFLLCILSLIGITFYLLSSGGDDEGEPTPTEASNENLFILTPDQIVDVYDGETFKKEGLAKDYDVEGARPDW